jgi:RimJ/RimL family protein N-acetyltransferase
MITGEHAHIRMADVDDAEKLCACYRGSRLQAACLDARREPFQPTGDEFREMLGKSAPQGMRFFAVEDHVGVIRAFCSLRSSQHLTPFAEVAFLFEEEDTLDEPVADDLFAFLCDRVFMQQRLHKLVGHCLSGETAMRDYLTRHGFSSQGVQREVLFAQGRWHDIEAMALLSKDAAWTPLGARKG